jgi:hypothetical protein
MDTNQNLTVEGIEFVAKDAGAGEVAAKLSRSFEAVHWASEKAGQSVKEMGKHAALGALGSIGLGFGLRSLAEKAKEANLEIEGTTKKIAGIHFAFQSWRADVPMIDRWRYSMEQAQDITEKLDESEERLKITRSELGGIYKSAFAIGSKHNLNQAQMLDLTEKLGAAEKVLGVSAEGAGLSISRAVMTGNIRGMDDFNKQLRMSVGSMKDFHKLSEAKRFEKLQKAMGDLVPAAEEMGKGLSGSMFTIHETTEQIFRDVSGPVFKAASHDLREWAQSFSRARADGQSLAHAVGDKLVGAFSFMKSATAFIADHWRSIADIWIANKALGGLQRIGSMAAARGKESAAAAGAAGGLLGGGMNVTTPHVTINYAGPAALAVGRAAGENIKTQLRPSLSETTARFTEVASKALILGQALEGLYFGASALAEYLLHQKGKEIEAQGTAARTMSAVSAFMGAGRELGGKGEYKGRDAAVKALSHMDSVLSAYGVKQGGQIPQAAIAADLRAMGKEMFTETAAKMGLRGDPAEVARYMARDFNVLLAELLKAYPNLATREMPVQKRADTNINIAKVEVTQEFKEADPDRVFHKAVNEINQMVHNPRTAVTAMAGD